MKTTYQKDPVIDAITSTMAPLERGSRAAKSLAKQRRYLAMAKKSMRLKASALAAFYLAQWKTERLVWAHLVGRVEG